MLCYLIDSIKMQKNTNRLCSLICPDVVGGCCEEENLSPLKTSALELCQKQTAQPARPGH